jgi:hypothetical protein
VVVPVLSVSSGESAADPVVAVALSAGVVALVVALALVFYGIAIGAGGVRRAPAPSAIDTRCGGATAGAGAMEQAGGAVQAHGQEMLAQGQGTGDDDLVAHGEHWVRDVVFGEDASTTRTGAAPQALAALRNLVPSFLHHWGRPDIAAVHQYSAGHPAVLFRRLGLRRL